MKLLHSCRNYLTDRVAFCNLFSFFLSSLVCHHKQWMKNSETLFSGCVLHGITADADALGHPNNHNCTSIIIKLYRHGNAFLGMHFFYCYCFFSSVCYSSSSKCTSSAIMTAAVSLSFSSVIHLLSHVPTLFVLFIAPLE